MVLKCLKRQKPYHCRPNYFDMAFFESAPRDLDDIAAILRNQNFHLAPFSVQVSPLQ